MTTIFVSHSSVDRPFVERHLVPFLSSCGLRAWYCKQSISSGSQWERSIRDGLETCDWVVIVVSPDAVASEWVRCEVDWALENRPSRLVPLLIGGAMSGDLHLRLRLIQAIDWAESPLDAKEGLMALWKVTPDDVVHLHEDPGRDLQYDDYLYPRPTNWHCIFCGWRCTEEFNDYICKQCDKIRPFAGGSATMIKCRGCGGFSLAMAQFCEWCGEPLGA